MNENTVKVIIDGKEHHIEKILVTMLLAANRKIENHSHKDRGGLRGWSDKTTFRCQQSLNKNMNEFLVAVDEYETPPTDNPFDRVSEAEVIAEGADVWNNVAILVNQAGAMEEGE